MKVKFQNCHLSFNNFLSCNFNRVDLQGSKLQDCLLNDNILRFTTISKTIVTKTNISKCKFSQLNMTGNVKFDNMIIKKTSFVQAVVLDSEIKMTKIDEVDFRNSVLKNVIFKKGVKITNSNFSASKFNTCDFGNVIISRSIFFYADFIKVKRSEAIITDSSFENATYLDTKPFLITSTN